MKENMIPEAMNKCRMCETINLPKMELGQWVNCGSCGRGATWEVSQQAWRCPLDGRIESQQGCSGKGI